MARELKITVRANEYWAEEDYEYLYSDLLTLLSSFLHKSDFDIEWID